MKFLITSTIYAWKNTHIIEQYPCLDDFGYMVESRPGIIRKVKIKDETGEYIYQDIPTLVEEPFIELEIYDGHRE